MIKVFKISFFILLFLIITITCSYSDTIYLKNGKVYEGKILKEDDEKLALKISIMTIIFYKENIERVMRFYPDEDSKMPEGEKFNIIDILKKPDKNIKE